MVLQLLLADAERRCAGVFVWPGYLNEVGLREQHSSNIALVVLARHAALHKGFPLSSRQLRQ